jgi:hypothetical protein
MHQGVNGPANEQVDMGVVLGLVPNVLNFAKYGRIDVVKLLKLVKYQIKGCVSPVFQTETEKLTE